MASKFPFEEFRCGGVADKLSSSDTGSKSVEGGNGRKKGQGYGVEDWRHSLGISSLSSVDGFYNDDSLEEAFIVSKYLQQKHQLKSFSGYHVRDSLTYHVVPPPTEACPQENVKLSEIPNGVQDVVESKKENRNPYPLAQLELLKSLGCGFKRLNGGRIIEPRCESICKKEPTSRLSTEKIMRVAGERFIQFSSQKVDVAPVLSNPFDLSFSGLSSEETEDVELADILLASAEKLGNQEFEHATRLLGHCFQLSSNTGNPVQRLVYYFSEALCEKLDQQPKSYGKKLLFNFNEAVTHGPDLLGYFQEVPFSQIEQVAGIQAIVENVAEAKKVHIIDLCIRGGVQWPLLMQALASRQECPLELLKITAVGTASRAMEDVGKRLTSFAKTMKLPFSYKIVAVADMLDLKEDHFELDSEETVAAYSMLYLWTLIALPDRLHSVMGVIRKINPCIIVVTEVESNNNSPVFVNRFIEALFFYGAYFDCLDACMERDDPKRIAIELMFGKGIKNIVAAEGEDRRVRQVNIDVWRGFFSHFEMEEKNLSMSSLYQADMMVKRFSCGNSCTLDMNGKSLIIGWKGTPIHSLSVWKFL
ncbi:DELLA protein RGL1-like [Tripterygium wilfordii]|uniref:DELLA protein RGL1-like n=1 Tax=Tripterygium wilfordii TaxID=458696 RepID=UPI0018F8308C|nr:DELLA protein RGL1-like [Tripterygium wilfordii]